MRLFVATAAPQRQKSDCAIVGLHEGGGLTGTAAVLDVALKGKLTRLLKRGDVHGKTGELRLVDTDGASCERVLIVGAGGGVATAAIQIAKLAGAIVYASTGGPEKARRAREIGVFPIGEMCA